MDVFVEQIVKKRRDMKDNLLAVGLVVLAIVLIFVIFLLSANIPMIGSFGLLLAVGAGFGAYWLITSQSLEFEYAVTNGDITVDKIIARRKRKRVVTVDAKNIEAMGKYKAQDHAQKNYDKRLMTAADANREDAWYISFRKTELGHVLLVFSPDERTLNAIRPFMNRQLAFEVFGRDAFNRRPTN